MFKNKSKAVNQSGEDVLEEKKYSKTQNRWAIVKKKFTPIFKLILLIELSFIIISPLFSQLCTTFIAEEDINDTTIKYITPEPTLDNYANIIDATDYWATLVNSIVVCLIVATLTTVSASLIGYGFAKFKFKFKAFFFAIVILTIIIPPATVMFPMYMKFRFFDFDILGLIKLLSGKGIVEWITGKSITLTNSMWPLVLLSITGFGFRGGLFTFLMRQFYRGVPNELSEAAYVDGAGVYRTYFSVIYPLGKSLRVTVFLLSFSWQWTDTFYSGLFFSNSYKVMANVLQKAQSQAALAGADYGLLVNTATMLILAPLLIIFLFGQNLMAEGIERSGIVG